MAVNKIKSSFPVLRGRTVGSMGRSSAAKVQWKQVTGNSGRQMSEEESVYVYTSWCVWWSAYPHIANSVLFFPLKYFNVFFFKLSRLWVQVTNWYVFYATPFIISVYKEKRICKMKESKKLHLIYLWFCFCFLFLLMLCLTLSPPPHLPVSFNHVFDWDL